MARELKYTHRIAAFIDAGKHKTTEHIILYWEITQNW
jgi:hypothetical protein